MKENRNVGPGSKTRRRLSLTSSKNLKKKKLKSKRKPRKQVKRNDLTYTNEQAVVIAIFMIRTLAQALDVKVSGVVERKGYKAGFAPVTPMRSGDTQRYLMKTGKLLIKYGRRSKLPILVDYF